MASDILSGQLQTEVRIDRLELGLFNRVVLHDVTVKDHAGKDLLSARLLSAKIEYRPLLEGRVSLRSVSLLDSRFNLYKETWDAPANYQFILDAFKSEKEGPSHLDITLNSLIIRRTRITYDERDVPRTPGKFSLSHVDVSDFDANISLKRLLSDSVNLRVRSLSFREHSGLDVRSLTFRLAAGKRWCDVFDFRLQLPESVFEEHDLRAVYDVSAPGGIGETIRYQGDIDKASLYLPDVACFLPVLRNYPYRVNLSTGFDIHQGDFHVGTFRLCESENRFLVEGNGNMLYRDGKLWKASGRLERLFLENGMLSECLSPLLRDSVPSFVGHLGDVEITGTGSYSPDELNRVHARISTGIGLVDLSCHGKDEKAMVQLSSEGLALSRLADHRFLPDSLAFHADARTVMEQGSPVSVALDFLADHLSVCGHEYRNFMVNGEWTPQTLAAKVHSADSVFCVDASAEGRFSGKKLNHIRVDANLASVNLHSMGLWPQSPDVTYSGRIEADVDNVLAALPDGYVTVTGFSRLSRSDSVADYRLDRLRLDMKSDRSSRESQLVLHSDFADMALSGRLSLPAVARRAGRLFDVAMSGKEENGSERKARFPDDDGEWKLSARLYRSDFFSQILGLPLDFEGPLAVNAYLGPLSARSSFTASAGRIDYGTLSVVRPTVFISSANGQLKGLLQGTKQIGKTPMTFSVDSEISHGLWSASLSWKDDGPERYKGLLAMKIRRDNVSGSSGYVMDILPTTLTLADTLWNVDAGRVHWGEDALHVDGFCLNHLEQSLSVEGTFSRNPSDELHADLKDIEVGYILSLVNLKPVSFSGRATGRVVAKPDANGKMNADGTLLIPDFHFNDGLMGRSLIRMGFTGEDVRLHFDAMMNEENIGSTSVTGFVGIKEKKLDLQVESHNTTLFFLRRYLSDLLGDITGRTTGHCHIHGSFKNLIFEGEEHPDMTARVLSTGCTYRLTDGTVNIIPSQFALNGFNVSDNNGGTGTLNGFINHEHLRHINYNIGVDARKLRLYDQPRSPYLPFYATACGTGSARIYGSPGTFTADLQVRTDKGTSFVYTVENPETDYDVSLLSFGQKHDGTYADTLNTLSSDAAVLSGDTVQALPSLPGTTDIHLNFLITATPDASFKVITDEKTGNYLRFEGNAGLRATWHNKGSFQMYGTYHVTDGVYKLILQDVIHKDFRLAQGGTIKFGGDPYEGDLALRAVYTVPSISLSDLGMDVGDKNVRADCILKLSGKVHDPQVSFDLGLDGVSSEVQTMVSQLLSTEEEKNMQILYLLGVGRFYNYNYATTEAAAGGQAQSSVAMKSFLSNTLSGQLNNFITNAVGASNWTFGANVSTGSVGWSDMEVAGLLSGRLMEGRLLVNGNFGYKERAYSSTNFIGDFDVTYSLTPSGSVNLKAYSETNERYFSRNSMTTQGVGILLRRDFFSFRDLFYPHRTRARLQKRREAKDL